MLIKYIVFFFMFLGIVISLNNSICSNRGNLIKNSSYCLCMEGYLTFPKDSIKKCNYEMKSEKTAFFLSFFLGLFGADMFYLGYNTRGFVKFILPLLLLTIGLVYRNNLNNGKLQYLSIIMPIVLLFLSWVYDIIRISSGSIIDVNNIGLIK